jgi:hypothetical protein
VTVHRQRALLFFAAATILSGCGGSPATSPPISGTPPVNLIQNLQPYPTPTGTISTYATAGSIDPGGIFFQPLGSNARNCASCHQLSQGMSLSAASIQSLFASTGGAAPLFLPIDGANCPAAATGDTAAHSLILNNGLIRISESLPATAQFQIGVQQDPYGCAVSTPQAYSVYRRPLPPSSLTFLSTIMWDARETASPLNLPSAFAANLDADLAAQSANAILTHEQGATAPTSAQLDQLAAFEEGLYSAEATDNNAGSLTADGATGGAAALAHQLYYPGINDAFGQDPQGKPFNPTVFTLFAAWENSSNAAQASIARGEDLFNSAPMILTNVRGLNDNPELGSPPVVTGSCGTCHDAPNIGTHSLPLLLDIGTSRLAATETDANILAGLAQLNAPSLPTYRLTGCADANGNPVTFTTTDPGNALVTGQCADIDRLTVPGLRGLAGRAPYFHNGSAASLGDVVKFYSSRFQMDLNPQQMVDLENFLNAL